MKDKMADGVGRTGGKHKAFRFLTSIRLAIILLVVFVIIFALDTLLPQGGTEQEYVARFGQLGAQIFLTLGLDHVLSSVWMYLCGILFAINLGLCTIKRVIWAWRVTRKKFRIDVWGSPVLHIGLCLVMIGSSLSFVLSRERYYEIPVGETASVQGRSGAFKLTAEDFGITYYDDEVTPRQYTSQIQIEGADGTTLSKTVEVNAPVKYDGVSILQQDFGWEVTAIISTERAQKEVTVKGEEWIPLSGEGENAVALGIAFYPDYSEKNGVPQLNSYRDKNPKLVWVLSQGGEPVLSNHLSMGETAVIQEPLKISFENYRYYTGLQTKYDPGITVIFGGFFLICLGLVMRFLFEQKQDRKKVEKNDDIDG